MAVGATILRDVDCKAGLCAFEVGVPLSEPKFWSIHFQKNRTNENWSLSVKTIQIGPNFGLLHGIDYTSGLQIFLSDRKSWNYLHFAFDRWPTLFFDNQVTLVQNSNCVCKSVRPCFKTCFTNVDNRVLFEMWHIWHIIYTCLCLFLFSVKK